MALSIAHAFVSAKSDGADATLVQPSNWNAQHSVTLANQRVMGRNTAGAGAVEEVTASQLFDWVSNTNGVLLTRTAGTWGALANVTTDNGDLVVANNASPVAPSAGSKLFSQSVGGRNMLGVLPATGAPFQFQPHIGRRKRAEWIPRPATTTLDVLGATATIIGGTATSRQPAITSLFTSLRRIGAVSAAGAASITGWFDGTSFHVWRGNAAGLGGWHGVWRFGISDAVLVTTANMFVGLRYPGSTPIDALPSTLTNILGVGCDNGDTQLQLYAAGSAAQARTSLGANFPVNTVSTDVYELILFAAANDTQVSYLVNRYTTSNITPAFTASGTISTNAALLQNTLMHSPHCWRSNGAGGATAVGIDLMGMYLETDL